MLSSRPFAVPRGLLGSSHLDDPMAILADWYEDARRSSRYEDFNAMTLATATTSGAPSARIVLCKGLELSPPALVFYTSYKSRKSRELGQNPRAAAVFYWPHARRQARLEGVVERVSDTESDAYFQSRPWLSRIGAIASRQSSPLQGRSQLAMSLAQTAARAALSLSLRRPEHWGGFRIHVNRMELWIAQAGRLHDRVEWVLTGDSPNRTWKATLLSP